MINFILYGLIKVFKEYKTKNSENSTFNMKISSLTKAYR